ncbi:hypothetical protein LGQ03_05950 [Loktanella sp. TSTF-M6]|uniref:Uncharacterized protein n=1 Tax=Loktanella gaetbuli TaxID=2881335 RepID=A0ABS8BSQ5_9RHOB|nr:hypothetical protein [Loktanella gaetbuli]MCB5198777.1 hypothetical protein [Loktanella gaetbuli]
MTETAADTRANRIDPVLRDAGWGVVEGSHVARELTIEPERIMGGGQRGVTLSADYVLSSRCSASTPLRAWMTICSVTAGRSS